MKRAPLGFSLVETAVALALLGIIVVSVLSAFSSTTLATTRHRQETDLDRLARSDAEHIKAQAYRPKPAVYISLGAAGYSFSTQVLYYSAATGTFAAANPDSGLQEVIVTVSTTAGAAEQVDILKVLP